MDLRLVLAGVLILGYVGFKGFERSGGKLPFSLSMGRSRALAARKPPAPEKLAFERVTLDAMPTNLQAFIRLTGNLERLGFRIVADFAIAGWPDTCFRGLVHREKPVHAVVVERQGIPAHVELFTLFDDLSALVTSTSEEAEDLGKPMALRFQQIPGLTLDELFVQHLSGLDNLFQDQLSPMPATRLAFFEHQRALLVIEHELRKAKRALRTDSLSRALEALPELPLQDLLKRYGLEDPPEDEVPGGLTVEMLPAKDTPTAEPDEAPRRWGVGSSLLSRRMAAREEGEAQAPPEVFTLEMTPEEASLPVEAEPEEWPLEAIVESSGSPDASLPFEVLPELPVESPATDEPLPFAIVAATPKVDEALAPEKEDLPSREAPPAEPEIKLPFEVMASDQAPVVIDDRTPIALPFEEVVEAAPGSRPTCPHCGATLFSSLSSRCSKCKQAVR